MGCAEQDDTMARARRGDERAWAELYRRHAGRLVVWLRHLPHADPAADAEDVAAEAWLTAARRVADFSGTGEDFGAWLFAIARNVARGRSRTARGRATTCLEPAGLEAVLGARADCGVDVGGEVTGADLARQLVARLPRREGEVVACLDVVGLDVEATCTALGMNAGAVRIAHMRGLRRLRRMFEVQPDVVSSRPRVTPVPARGM
jgi:RNA polymerase sigma-70 factor (ECF subfamily)